jgi:hypothetical protein
MNEDEIAQVKKSIEKGWTVVFAATLIVAGFAAMVAGGLAWYLATEETPYDPISFVNPAIVQFPDGTVPTISGIEGPAVKLGEEGEAVLPITWTERNYEDTPVPATFNFTRQSFQLGVTIDVYDGEVDRQPFQPGIVQYDAFSAIDDKTREAVEDAASSGICVTEWQNIASATPLRESGVEASFYSQNYSIVHPCYGQHAFLGGYD